MSNREDATVTTEAKVPALSVPQEFGRAMRQIHSGELTALSQRQTIRELRTASGMIVKIEEPPR